MKISGSRVWWLSKQFMGLSRATNTRMNAGGQKLDKYRKPTMISVMDAIRSKNRLRSSLHN
jgi:hypothetical protein